MNEAQKQILSRCSHAIGPFFRDDDIKYIKSDIVNSLPEEWDEFVAVTHSSQERTEIIRSYIQDKPHS